MPVPLEFKKRYGEHFLDGVPYRGDVYDMKADDPEDKRPIPMREVHIRQFCTDVQQDLEDWTKLSQAVADGVAQISFESKEYDPDKKAWRILVRWMEFYYTKPEGVG